MSKPPGFDMPHLSAPPFLTGGKCFWRRDMDIKLPKNLRESEMADSKQAAELRQQGKASLPPSLSFSHQLIRTVRSEGILLQVGFICSSPGSLIREQTVDWTARTLLRLNSCGIYV
ncbi:hypothetical protein PBY51_017176 [Eleginops maclovinus]|uniref:Uncharacterized protein n=1 Tax=Eleginops maclovinus TaxID=56733 RepID=A0AAN7XJ98_ELEMC|nr:hypothetical protein PBY51_017176 [Eleginops maclovinus]